MECGPTKPKLFLKKNINLQDKLILKVLYNTNWRLLSSLTRLCARLSRALGRALQSSPWSFGRAS